MTALAAPQSADPRHEQRMRALQRAHAVRLAYYSQRRALKRKQPPRPMSPERLADAAVARERANLIRSYRARLKRDVFAGRVSLYDVLRDPPDEILTMKLAELLRAMPYWGQCKVERTLGRIGIDKEASVVSLDARQWREVKLAVQVAERKRRRRAGGAASRGSGPDVSGRGGAG